MTILTAVFLFFLILVINLLLWALVCIGLGMFLPAEEGGTRVMFWLGGIAGLVTTCMEFAAGWVPPL